MSMPQRVTTTETFGKGAVRCSRCQKDVPFVVLDANQKAVCGECLPAAADLVRVVVEEEKK